MKGQEQLHSYTRDSLIIIIVAVLGISVLTVLAVLFASPYYDERNFIKATVKSYDHLSAMLTNVTLVMGHEKINSISSVSSSFVDNGSIMGQTSTKPRITNNQTNITISFIKIHKFWNKDPVKVYLDINPRTFEQSVKYVIDVQKAISTWSKLLKIYSGNYNSWNFEINNDSLREFPKASIIIKISSDPFGQICNAVHGGRSYALTIYPQIHDTNVYIDMANSCVVQGQEYQISHQEMYSTMLHEFGHALGLGHAYNSDGDLMCGTQGTNGAPLETCKPYSVKSAIPSILDLKALFYAYGKDGFNEPNNKAIEDHGVTRYNNTVA